MVIVIIKLKLINRSNKDDYRISWIKSRSTNKIHSSGTKQHSHTSH